MRRRTPFVFQMASAECGLACVAMIAATHGRRTSLADLRERIEVGRDGVSAFALVEVAAELGLTARAVAASPARLAELPLPCIAVWENAHFVVVTRVTEKYADILDPARGRRRLDRAEFDDAYQGVALLYDLAPADLLAELAVADGSGGGRRAAVTGSLSAAWRPLWVEARRAANWFGVLFGVTILAHLLSLAGPLLIGRAVDQLAVPVTDASALLLAVAVVVLATWLVGAARAYASVHLQRRLDERLAPRFFGHLLSLPHHELERRGTGDLMGRMESLTLARLALTSQVINTLLDAGLVVIAGIALFSRSSLFGLTVVVAVLTQLVPLVALSRPIHESTNRAAMCEGYVHGFTAEALQGIATLKSVGAEGAAQRRFAALAAERREAETRRDVLAGRVETVLVTVRVAAPLVVLMLGYAAVTAGQLALGDLVASVGLAAAAVSPASSFVSGARAVQAARSHLVRLADVWALETEPVGGAVELGGAIELRQVGVRYPGCPEWAVGEVSLRIEPGEHVAVVGRSGSGKSTLVKVVAGLLEPSSGEVLYDDRPATTLGARSVRRAIGVVLQDVWLFAGTIEENITVDREVDPLGVRRATRLAGIDDDIEALPLGYQTRLSDGGSGLSGGQRQRIAVARALAHEPRVVVLDEATSHLDVLSEAHVSASLAQLGVTRISVAHRLSTVRRADRIVVMERGRIVQVGSYEELAAVPGPFRALVEQDAQGTPAAADSPVALGL